MKKIGIVVVTYNRLECLKKNLSHLMNLVSPEDCTCVIYLIDNASTDGTEEYIKLFNESKYELKYIRLDENTGGSGGFYYGVKQAYDDGVDFVFGMDDDAYVDSACLLEFLNSYNEINEECCLFANSNFDQKFDGGYKKVKNWMFVGFFIPRVIIDKVGFPRGDLFIYHDDTEYSFRIQKAGYCIYKIKNAIIEHRMGSVKYLPSKKFLFINIEFYDLPDWKLYYFIRNIVLKYRKTYYRHYVCLMKACSYVLKIYVLNRKQYTIAKKALRDGLKGITGKVVEP